MGRIYHLKSLVSIVTVALTISTSNVYAAQLGYQLELGVEHSNNVTASGADPIATATSTVGLQADFNQQAANYSLNIEPGLQYRSYSETTFDDQLFVSLDAGLLWNISKQRFSWTFEDYLDQSAIDSTSASTPFNQQDTNVFLTGPDVTFRLGPVQRIELLARYLDFYYENTDADNNRYGVLARWIRQPNAVSTYGLNVDAADIRYKDPLNNEDYTRYDAFVSIEKKLSTYDLDIKLGYTEIERDFSENLDDFLAQARLNYRINSKSSINLSAISEYTDSSRNFLLSRASREGVRSFNTQINGSVFYLQQAFAGYTWSDHINVVNIEYSINTDEYDAVNSDLDRKVQNYRLGINRAITGHLSVSFDAQLGDSEYSGLSRKDEDTSVGLAFSYRMSRSLSLQLGAQRSERESSTETLNYVENIGYMSVHYSRPRRRLN